MLASVIILSLSAIGGFIYLLVRPNINIVSNRMVDIKGLSWADNYYPKNVDLDSAYMEKMNYYKRMAHNHKTRYKSLLLPHDTATHINSPTHIQQSPHTLLSKKNTKYRVWSIQKLAPILCQ